jgi:hypothetical protein
LSQTLPQSRLGNHLQQLYRLSQKLQVLGLLALVWLEQA